MQSNAAKNYMMFNNMGLKLDKNRIRKVVFYGRVSTEHEAQLAALENQLKWYDDQATYHPNWEIHRKYIDEGITGTQAKKRPAFMQMLEDAKNDEFDLIVTREVCRFARNTVDALVATRDLKNIGVEVFFVEDNIWTMDGDGELRLTIMATLAQEESRKVSERVRAGQKISRDKGVLYGNSNILGYNRMNGTYVIDVDQAETVKMVYDLYISGLGEKRIVNELLSKKRKDAHGNVSWTPSKIGRILHNATYKGYKVYFKSFSNNYLEQKRINNLDEDTYMYIKGDFEPIVSEEIWDKCAEIRKSRTKKMIVNNREVRYGKPKTNDAWIKKLCCKCGSTYRKNKWHTNKGGDESFGYQCYNQVNNGSLSTRIKYGLDAKGYCDIRMIGDWKLDLMAKMIFEEVWTERKEAVVLAYQMVQDCYQEEKVKNESVLSVIESKISKLQNKIDGLLNMRMEGEITKEEYQKFRGNLDKEMEELLINRETVGTQEVEQISSNEKMVMIKNALDGYIDFSNPTIPLEIIEKFVMQVTPMENHIYLWKLNLGQDKIEEIQYGISGRKNKPIFLTMENDEKSLFTYDSDEEYNIDRYKVDGCAKKNTCLSTTPHRQR